MKEIQLNEPIEIFLDQFLSQLKLSFIIFHCFFLISHSFISSNFYCIFFTLCSQRFFLEVVLSLKFSTFYFPVNWKPISLLLKLLITVLHWSLISLSCRQFLCYVTQINLLIDPASNISLKLQTLLLVCPSLNFLVIPGFSSSKICFNQVFIFFNLRLKFFLLKSSGNIFLFSFQCRRNTNNKSKLLICELKKMRFQFYFTIKNSYFVYRPFRVFFLKFFPSFFIFILRKNPGFDCFAVK